MNVGDIVSHKIFGKGKIVAIFDKYAEIDFDGYGTKHVIFKYFDVVKEQSNDANAKTVVIDKPTNKFDAVTITKAAITLLENSNKTKIEFNECMNFLWSHFSYDIKKQTIEYLFSPTLSVVFLKHLKKVLAKINNGKIANIDCCNTIIEEKRDYLPGNNIDDFETASMKDEFCSSVKLYFALSIVDFVSNINKIRTTNVFEFNSVANYILNCFIYQISVGEFLNDSETGNPTFYKRLVESVKDNVLTDDEKSSLTIDISNYLITEIIPDFLQGNHDKAHSIFSMDEKNNLHFSDRFVSLLKPKVSEYKVRLINRLSYFLSKLNNPLTVKAYIQNIKNGLDKKNFVLRFEYQDNLEKMRETLDQPFYLKNDFKKIMKEFGIPPNDTYLRMCLDRIDYTLKTKRIILKSQYPTLKAYYKSIISDVSVYRYSNPLNLDEYDNVLKSLMNELELIEVEPGTYVTKKNFLDNGITDETITSFAETINNMGKERKYFSLEELNKTMADNPIVSYCGNNHQLLQFIRPIKNIKIIDFKMGGHILTYSSSTNIRGEFIEYIIGKNSKMNIYDIRDYVEEKFGINYSLDEIIADSKKTDYYYSDELETVYKTKQDYAMEVYDNAN